MKGKNTVPIDYRIYDKDTDGKTKNTHFCEMLSLAKKRGIKPNAVVTDAWYSSLNKTSFEQNKFWTKQVLNNLKTIRDHGWIWVTALKKNRKVNKNESLSDLKIPDEGLRVHLRGYGWVTVFKFEAKNGRIDYVTINKENPTHDDIEKIIKARWSIEVYHRELKQTCGIERCQARTGRAQRNHICMAILAWINKHRNRITRSITLYQQKWEIIKRGIAQEIKEILSYP